MQVNPFIAACFNPFRGTFTPKWATVPLSLKEMLFSNKILFLIVFEVVDFKFEIIYKEFECFHQKMLIEGAKNMVF